MAGRARAHFKTDGYLEALFQLEIRYVLEEVLINLNKKANAPAQNPFLLRECCSTLGGSSEQRASPSALWKEVL